MAVNFTSGFWRRYGPLSILLTLAFCVRVVVIAPPMGSRGGLAPMGDEIDFDVCAWNVAQGHGYRGPSPGVADPNHPTAYRSPGTALYYAAIYRLCGHRYSASRLANAALGTLTVWLLFCVAARCSGGRAAWLTAGAYAVYPPAILYTGVLSSETLTAFLVCLFLLACLSVGEKRGAVWACLAGVIYGLLLLTMPGYALLAPLLPVWGMVVLRGQRGGMWRTLAVFGVALTVVTLWSIRNALVMKAFIPFNTRIGSELLRANNRIVVDDPLYAGGAIPEAALPEYAAALSGAGGEVVRDAVAQQCAMQWLRANPDKWAYLLGARFHRFWTPQALDSSGQALATAFPVLHAIGVLLFAIVVAPVSGALLRRRHPGLLLPLLIFTALLLALATHGEPRWRFPIDGLCLAVIAAALAHLLALYRAGKAEAWLQEFAARNRTRASAILVCLIALAIVRRMNLNYIESCRDTECRQRLQAISRAVESYRHLYGRDPEQLADLVPRFLPDFDSLHCPAQSLLPGDYVKLSSREGETVPYAISYTIAAPIYANTPVRIVENEARHSGRANYAMLNPF